MSDDTLQKIAEHDGRHLRVLAPPAGGKTRALIARFERLRADGRDPAVITFSRDERERIVERILPRQSAFAGRIPVYTYHQLALDVVSRGRPGRHRPLGDVEEHVVLSRALRAAAGDLESDYRSIVASDALHRALLEVFHTLLQNGVDAADAELTVAAARSARARDVMRLFVAFCRTLDDKGLSTYYDVAWQAASLLSRDPSLDPLGSCDTLLIDDFQDLDAGQFGMVTALAPAGGARRVNVFGDPTGARFAFRGTSARFLRDEFVAQYAPDDIRLPAGCGAHAVLGAAVSGLLAHTSFDAPTAPPPGVALGDLPLFGAVESAPAALGGPGVVTLAIAEDEIAEAQHVAATAAELIAAGRAPSDIAVLARDRSRYERALLLAFRDHGVAFDAGVAGVFALDTFAGALMGLMGERFDDRLAEVAVSSPFFAAWRGRFAERLELGERRAERDAADLRRIVGYVRAVCADRKTGVFSMARFMDECVRPVVAAPENKVSDEAVAGVARMADEWDAYADMLRHVGGRPDVDEFRAHHRAAATAVAPERDPRCVSFFTAREAATRVFPVVFVVGCADGLFPMLEARESYVPYDEIESMLATHRIEFFRARGHDERLRDERALLLTAITRARDALHVSAPQKIMGEVLPEAPCRALAPIAGAVAAARVERREGPRLRAARAVVQAGPGFDAAKVAAALPRIPRMWLGSRAQPRPFTLGRFALSPSRLSTYVGCARKFFYGRVLGIDEERTIHLTIGSLFHDVLDAIGKEMPTRDELMAGLTPERIGEFVDDAVRASRDLGPEGSLVESVSRFYLNAMVGHFRALESKRVDACRIETELSGDFERGGWSFSGRMDRVDSDGGAVRVVIDYKTSSSQGANSIHKKGVTIRDYMMGAKGNSGRRYWQIPMYAEGARAGGERYPDLFCYYVIPPGEDPYVAGVYISDDPDARKKAPRFEAGAQKYFSSVPPADIDAVMDEVVGYASDIFSERDAFPRTDDVSRCRNCSFNRVCERRDA